MKTARKTAIILALMLVVSSFFVFFINAEPEGAAIDYVSETMKNATAPGSRIDAKGNITTILISTIQQNIRWKAYVGNVSGTLVLRDAQDFSIYEWDLGGSPEGEVYITMNNSVDWSSLQCANTTEIQVLEAALGHGASSSDNIRNTFSKSLHASIDVGDMTIPGSSCSTTTTWVNNSVQADSTSALFQEVLLMDASGRIVFTSIISQDTHSYRDDASEENTRYDFQAIVPDFVGSNIATYYFYVEISG